MKPRIGVTTWRTSGLKQIMARTGDYMRGLVRGVGAMASIVL
jgi:hypothetical protein